MNRRSKFFPLLTLLIAIGLYTYNYYTSKKNHLKKTNTSEVNTTNSSSFNFLPSSTTGQIAKHNYYTLSYNELYEQAEWVAHQLKGSHITHNNRKRPYFIDDPKILSKSASYRNYKNSGYDRGHLCPAGDRKFSLEAFKETFYTSNISPQNHDFNTGIWNRLEQKTRYWAKKYEALYVITGGILTKNLKTIGKEHVAVPKYFYKILLDYTKPEIKAIAFLMLNKDSNKPLYNFVVSIDEIEKRTGIDFFPALPDALENKLEASSNYKNWSFR